MWNSIDSGEPVYGRVDEAADGAGDSWRLSISGAGLGVLAALIEMAVIVSVSLLTGIAYHLWVYATIGPVWVFAGVGTLAALIYMVPYVLAGQHRVQDFIEGRRTARRGLLVWHYTFMCLALMAFVTKTTDDFSRGWMLLFFLAGLLSVIGFELMFKRVLRPLLATGRITTRRMILIGTAGEIRRIASDKAMQESGVRVVAVVAFPSTMPAGPACAPDDEVLAAALAKARSLRVDDVVILMDWSQSEALERIMEVFAAAPVEIHLGASSVIDRFRSARVSHFASLTALSLTAPALGPVQSMVKRAGDAVGALLALVLLAPLFAVIAVLIKLDSPGPVFFRQRRNGFNKRQFLIWKFRTMTTMDDGKEIVQAKRGDARVTRLGAFLRQHSLDELPQLVNVLKGEMSLVGPRPHAVAHDEMYGKLISTYTRRLNVLPGMTGWAQVNGARGPTETEADMRRRVELDLHYIDNWSIAFDVYILVRTVISAAARRNAF